MSVLLGKFWASGIPVVRKKWKKRSEKKLSHENLTKSSIWLAVSLSTSERLGGILAQDLSSSTFSAVERLECSDRQSTRIWNAHEEKEERERKKRNKEKREEK